MQIHALLPRYPVPARGVQVVGLSSNVQERGFKVVQKVSAQVVKFGYGLSLRSARQWGLYKV